MKTNSYQVVFHLEDNDKRVLNIAINNLANLIVDQHNIEAAFVANVKSPLLFITDLNEDEHIKRLSEWVNLGLLKIYICNNSLKNLNISSEQILPFCEIVPAGISKLIKLQHEGFAYIKP